MIKRKDFEKLTLEEKIDYNNYYKNTIEVDFISTIPILLALSTILIMTLGYIVLMWQNGKFTNEEEISNLIISSINFVKLMWIIVISHIIWNFIAWYIGYKKEKIWIKKLNLEER